MLVWSWEWPQYVFLSVCIWGYGPPSICFSTKVHEQSGHNYACEVIKPFPDNEQSVQGNTLCTGHLSGFSIFSPCLSLWKVNLTFLIPKGVLAKFNCDFQF